MKPVLPPTPEQIFEKKTTITGFSPIDLKNLCDYEEMRLPKWSDLDEDELSDIFSSKTKKKPQRPPPGFSALNPIQEESPENSTVNSASFKHPNSFSAPNPNLASFLNPNLYQNSFPSFGVNSPNMFFQNGLNRVNPALDATGIQMEIVKLQMQIDSYRMMFGQSTSGVMNASYAVFLQEQINILVKRFQELQIHNAQQANSQNSQMQNPQSPQMQNPQSPQMNTSSDTTFQNIPQTPQESPKPSEAMPDLGDSQQSFPSPSIHNASSSSSINGNVDSVSSSSSFHESTQSELEKVEENPNFWKPEEKVDQDSKTCPIKDECLFNPQVENFFNEIPKLNEDQENCRKIEFKDTNPFKVDLMESENTHANLRSFYDATSPDSSTDPNLYDKSKTEPFPFSSPGNETGPDLFMFDRVKNGNIFSDLDDEEPVQRPKVPLHKFDPVLTSTLEKVEEQNSRIFYEASPVIYNEKETVEKVKSNIYNTTLWKPIPPAESTSTSEPAVKISVSSFNIMKAKSVARRLKEHKQLSNSNSVEKSVNVNVPDNPKDSRSSPNFNLPSSWTNSRFEHSEKEIEECLATERSPSLEDESSRSWIDHEALSGKYPSIQISVTVSDNSHLLKSSLKEEACQRLKFREKECSVLENEATCPTRNTNPFRGDINVTESEKEADKDVNGLSKNLESFKLFEHVTESSKIETSTEVSPSVDDSSVYFVHHLTCRDKSVVVIDVSGEGWLSTDEFVEAFTHFDVSSVMLSVLNMMSLNIPFKIIDRVSHPSLIATLDKSPLNVPRNSQNKIFRSVHLTPLKSTLRILTKLNIIKREEICAAVARKSDAEGTILSDMMKLISYYGSFTRSRSKN